jgi:hypothetical protein
MKPEDPKHPSIKDESLSEPTACGTHHLDFTD